MQPNSRVYFALAAHIKTHITALSQRHVTQSPSVSQLCSAEISCAARLHKETKMRRQGGEGEARVCSAKPDALVTFLNTTSLLGEPKLKRAANTNMYEQANACCEFTLKKILQTLSLNLTASASHYDLWHTMFSLITEISRWGLLTVLVTLTHQLFFLSAGDASRCSVFLLSLLFQSFGNCNLFYLNCSAKAS